MKCACGDPEVLIEEPDQVVEETEEASHSFGYCPDCGEPGHGIGDMECLNPQDHNEEV